MENSEINCGSCIGACCRAGTTTVFNAEEAQFMLSAGANYLAVFPARPDVIWAERIQGWGIQNPEYSQDPERSTDPEPWELFGYAADLKKPDKGLYKLTEDCPFLVERESPQMRWQCMIHEDPRRPKVCQTFVPGSAPCISIRQSAGVDPA